MRLAVLLTLSLLAASLTPQDGRVAISGTAVLVEADGTERAELDGSFLLNVQDAPGLGARVEVSGGRWSARAPAGAFVRPVAMELDGRGALLHSAWTRAEEGLELALRGREVQAPTVLRVVSAEDRADLNELEVGGNGFGREHPGPACDRDALVTGARSPVTLPPRELDQQLPIGAVWVRAPGSAWQRVDFDPLRGGVHEVELRPGGAVEVTVEGAPAPRDAQLFLLRGPQEELTMNQMLDEGTFRVEGLLPGRYLARAVRGFLPECPRLGECELEVRAGETARATLPLTWPEPPARGGLVEATLIVPEAWPRADVQLEVHSLDEELQRWVTCVSASDSVPTFGLVDMHRVGDDRWVWRWQAPYAGRYLLRVKHPYVLRVLDVTDQPLTTRLELPAPARVRLRLVDAETGESVLIAGASWTPAVAPELQGRTGGGGVEVTHGRWSLEFEAQSGPLLLHAHGNGRTREEVVQLKPGDNELEWRLEPERR